MATPGRRHKDIAAAIAVILVAAVAGIYLPKFPSEPGPGSMVLLPHYGHESGGGIDSRGGHIWRWGGPEIDYEIGGFRATLTIALPDITSVSERLVNGHAFTVIMQSGQRFAIVFEDANFEVTHVQTQQEIDDIVRMVMTYSSPYWKGVAFPY
jgi:hypothetical protein